MNDMLVDLSCGKQEYMGLCWLLAQQPVFAILLCCVVHSFSICSVGMGRTEQTQQMEAPNTCHAEMISHRLKALLYEIENSIVALFDFMLVLLSLSLPQGILALKTRTDRPPWYIFC